jgi:hypothetical protein
MSRTLYFQQITDSRFEPIEKCLPILQERINRIKELLNIEGVNVKIEEPYMVDWRNTSENNIQYRVNFYVTKTTRKLTWNDIYNLINSIKPVSYKFLQRSK